MINPALQKQGGLWPSHLDIDHAVDRSSSPEYPFYWNNNYYWIESIASQNGRNAVVTVDENGNKHVLTPSEFNIRTRVNEYGGKCFSVFQNWLIFNNYLDNSLYIQNLDSVAEPKLLFSAANVEHCCGFADIQIVAQANLLLAVSEQINTDVENSNFLLAIPLEVEDEDGDKNCSCTDYSILAEGADFYSNPVVNESGNKIAWVEWFHPNMPWDQSRLMQATLKTKKGVCSLKDIKQIMDRPNVSVFQPGYLDNKNLLFVSDGPDCDFWNLFLFDGDSVRQITHDHFEYGEAHWAFGQTRWISSVSHEVIAIGTLENGDQLFSIDIKSGNSRAITDSVAQYRHLRFGAEAEILVVAHYGDRMPEVLRLNNSRESPYIYNSQSIFIEKNRSNNVSLGCSKPELLEINKRTDHQSYAYFYPPCHSNFDAEKQSTPLIITVHGGPTGRAGFQYNGLKQYFCSLGFAVLDINHRGSTGYGRAFRQSLLGQWGLMDVVDIAASVNTVVALGRANPDLVFIRGSSAGGYAVLRALTEFPELFSGGASYYGIGNLITLSEITHKFESRYTDRLIGDEFDPVESRKHGSRFMERSPINNLDRIECPLILFQGGEDKVVPPELAREMAKALEKRNITYAYTEYPGEGHGFRIHENRKDALKREIKFYQAIIKSR